MNNGNGRNERIKEYGNGRMKEWMSEWGMRNEGVEEWRMEELKIVIEGFIDIDFFG